MITPVSTLAVVLILAGCSSGEKAVPQESIFSGQTQTLDKARETAAAIEQMQAAQQQQIQRATAQNTDSSPQ